MVNGSVFVFVGKPVSVEEKIRVTIDCSQLIDEVIDSTGVSNPTISWYKDGLIITNGSERNVLISADNRLCVITHTLRASGALLGTDGNYTCQVCTDSTMTACMINETVADFCGELNQFN